MTTLAIGNQYTQTENYNGITINRTMEIIELGPKQVTATYTTKFGDREPYTKTIKLSRATFAKLIAGERVAITRLGVCESAWVDVSAELYRAAVASAAASSEATAERERLEARVAELGAEVSQLSAKVAQAEAEVIEAATLLSPDNPETYAKMVGQRALTLRRLRDERNGLIRLLNSARVALEVAVARCMALDNPPADYTAHMHLSTNGKSYWYLRAVMGDGKALRDAEGKVMRFASKGEALATAKSWYQPVPARETTAEQAAAQDALIAAERAHAMALAKGNPALAHAAMLTLQACQREWQQAFAGVPA
jgi:hypothetical protein